jgi:hypothetical protein
MAMAKRKAKAEPDGRLSLTVNGHTITGESRNGRWTFRCDSWPDLEDQFGGADNTTGVLTEFMRRTLENAVTIRNLASES